MKILHTADWHVGKKLGRFDRLDEAKACLDEVVAYAEADQVDLVIVAGDLFDRALPPFAVMGVVFDALQRLADTGATVVAIAGNHDSAELFRVLKPYFASSRIYLADKALPPEDGGVVRVASRDGKTTAQVALFPFLHEARVSDLMESADDWHKKYADRIKRLCSVYGEHMSKNSGPDTIEILVGHFMINGAIPSGSERGLHIGEAFTAETQALPSDIDYGALGHIHLSQEAPGSAVAAHYSGSLLQLDFGEKGQDKNVLLVELRPGSPGQGHPQAHHQGPQAHQGLGFARQPQDEGRRVRRCDPRRRRADRWAGRGTGRRGSRVPAERPVRAGRVRPRRGRSVRARGAQPRRSLRRVLRDPSRGRGQGRVDRGVQGTRRRSRDRLVRPLVLEMSGFRSHELKTEISFENRNFIAIVGPTGAGKSSILDAISFALYSKTPRLRNKTKRLICSRTDAAHVKLLFEVEGKKYEVSRVLRNSGTSEHLLVDLASGEKFTGESSVTETIEELLGLDFDAFCSSVLLAQGRFSEFLEAATTKKMQILKGVFRMDQIDDLRKAAKSKVADFELEVREVSGELGGIPEDLADLITTEKDGLKDLDGRAATLTEALPREKLLIKEAEGAEAEKAAATKELAAAESSLASLPESDVLTGLADEEDELARVDRRGRREVHRRHGGRGVGGRGTGEARKPTSARSRRSRN